MAESSEQRRSRRRERAAAAAAEEAAAATAAALAADLEESHPDHRRLSSPFVRLYLDARLTHDDGARTDLLARLAEKRVNRVAERHAKRERIAEKAAKDRLRTAEVGRPPTRARGGGGGARPLRPSGQGPTPIVKRQRHPQADALSRRRREMTVMTPSRFQNGVPRSEPSSLPPPSGRRARGGSARAARVVAQRARRRRRRRLR